MSSILSVSQLNTYISFKIKNDPKLRGIAVKGEISDLSVNRRSNHMYFSLRDSDGSVSAVMFASNAQKLQFAPYDGMSVIAYGNIDVYGRDSRYQIVVSQLVPDGAGSGYLSLIKLKEKLSAMGIFDAPKRAIPRYPKNIAVVTSPTGAALQDVRSIVFRRYPIAGLTLFPTAVQGADAHLSIASALKEADRSGADVIILTRGGGSSEDLSAFNTEAVALAVYDCQTPVISAVGHEIDWTLCDLAADLRAPTPSGAAELATPDINDMKNELKGFKALLSGSAESKIKSCRFVLSRYEYALSAFSASEKIANRRSELRAIKEAVEQRTRHMLKVSRITLSSLSGILESLGPNNVISRGYALVLKDGEVASDITNIKEGDSVRIVMRGGSADAEVKKIIGDENEL